MVFSHAFLFYRYENFNGAAYTIKENITVFQFAGHMHVGDFDFKWRDSEFCISRK